MRSSLLSISMSLFLAVALGGGVAIAANKAMPGEMLYPFKISINERLESTFAKNSEARVRLHIKLMQARLDEATTLAAAGTLDTDIEAALTQNFTAHATAAAAEVANADAAGNQAQAAAMAATFHATLAQQAATLTDTSIKSTPEVQASLASVLAGVQQVLSTASAASAQAAAEAAGE